MSWNKINDKQTIIFICNNGTWKALEYLYLGDNPAVLEATDALKAIKDITSKSLEEIDLPGARFERVSLQCLKYNESESFIELSVFGCTCRMLPLSKKGYNAFHASVIGLNTTWTHLQTLNLRKKSIGAEGATVLSQNTTWTHLQELHLGDNEIGDEGATALSQNTTWTNLQTINLEYNSIGDKGATALSQNTTWTNLQALHLWCNSIGAEGPASLKKNQAWPKDIQIR